MILTRLPEAREDDLACQAEWLHEVLRRHVTEVVVCDPRRNKLLSEGSKGDHDHLEETFQFPKTAPNRR